uniref:Uncharacterized protein n=1 Tax=Picea glauca TaxID=3330 RepID=A0A101LUG9_PICGL|nr:hypothetical protein ABT39_MTgene2419 [Picea glauca]
MRVESVDRRLRTGSYPNLGTQLLVEQGTLGGAEHLPYIIIHMIDMKSYPCLLNVRVVSGISFTYIRRMLIGCAH